MRGSKLSLKKLQRAKIFNIVKYYIAPRNAFPSIDKPITAGIINEEVLKLKVMSTIKQSLSLTIFVHLVPQ
ncbi:hypothetical protein C463_12437 [Halorubrum californiense DSM 19288]|uniref:Uncharacterized protein n=1 Tax=Halorubrum californiense DSM 19288 TaxID=1227465 RepID=M0E543_9EURY|nr:hypothetical protein C463_12437 [Halorubrum californiense DSM 19288]